MVTFPSHHKQWGKVSFEIRREGGYCCSDSLKSEMAGGKGISAPHPTTYIVGETKAHEVMTVRDPQPESCTTCRVSWAVHHQDSMAPHSLQVGTRPTHQPC
jgi:hypothetical protein